MPPQNLKPSHQISKHVNIIRKSLMLTKVACIKNTVKTVSL